MDLMDTFTHVPVDCSHVYLNLSADKRDEHNLHLQDKRSSQRRQTRR